MKEYKEFSKTKKKSLIESIRIAKELYDAKYKNDYDEKPKINNIIKKSSDISSNVNNSLNTNSIGNSQSNTNNIGLNNNSSKENIKKDGDKKIKGMNNSINSNINAACKDNLSSNN